MKRRNSTAKLVRRQVSLDFPKPNGRWHGSAVPDQPNGERKSARKSPQDSGVDITDFPETDAEGGKALGKEAQPGGKKLKRGAAVPVVCYPRPVTKAMLVHASQIAGRSLSSFMILASLKEAAAIKGVQVEDLIPEDEFKQYR